MFTIPLLIIGITFIIHGIFGITTDDSLILAKNTIYDDLKKIEKFAEEEADKFKQELINKLHNNKNLDNPVLQQQNNIDNNVKLAVDNNQVVTNNIVNTIPIANQLGNLIGNTLVYSNGTVEYKAI